MKRAGSYLSRLKFDPALATSWIASYLTNIRLVGLFVLTIITVGISSFVTLPQRLNPEIQIPIVSVITILPGAGPQDVESLITIPIEDEIAGVEGIDTVTSNSSNSVSAVTVQFLSTVSQEQAKNDIQSAVDAVSGLPEDAQTPRVQVFDFENQPIWVFSLTTAYDDASLMQFASLARDRLEDLTLVDRVELTGDEEEEISITISQETVQELGINPIVLSQTVTSALASYPAGEVESFNSVLSLTLDPTVTSIDKLRDTPITLDGTVYTLGEIATITFAPKPQSPKTYYATATKEMQRAVTVYVYKTSGATIDTAAASVQDEMGRLLREYDGTFELVTIQNTADLIDEQFGDLTSNFVSTIFLVFATLLVFLGIRQALIVSLSIPLTFLISFSVMRFTGLSINFLSLFSLLLALGLLVDDAIVVVSAMTAYHRTKKFTAQQTGLLVWRDFIVPIWTTTITTVWAFAPLLLSTGIIGEFIKTIPIVVSSTLLASTTVAVLVTLPMMMSLLNLSIPKRVVFTVKAFGLLMLATLILALIPKTLLFVPTLIVVILLLVVTYTIRRRIAEAVRSRVTSNLDGAWQRAVHMTKHGFINMEYLQALYYRRLVRVLGSKSARRKIVAAVIIFSVFSYALVPLGFVINEFFPKTDEDIIYMSLELPSGTKQEVTDARSRQLLNELRKTEDISHVFAEIGRSIDPSMGSSGASGPNTALFTIVLPEYQERGSIAISEELRDSYDSYTAGTLSVVEVSGGPPAGADIQIKVKGEDLGTLDAYADSLVSHLRQQSGVTNVTKSIKPSTSKLVFTPERKRLSELGLSNDAIGLWMRVFATGLTLDTARFESEERDVTLRIDPSVKPAETISTISIPTQSGPVPLSSLGTITLAANPTQITREDGDRTISVSASVTTGYSITELNRSLEAFADQELALEADYTWETGGVNEENQRSVNSIFQAMLLTGLLILVTMVIQLGSFRKAFIVMLVIPLALSGVFIMFAITGTPLSFPALIGVLALFGIVVNNSIVVVEKINQNIAARIPLKEAIADASANRLEPIFFSSLTTIIGLAPITLSDPLWQGLGGAIIAGLMFSGTIMLLFIPTMYYIVFVPSHQR